MPKIIIHAPDETFTREGRAALVSELTDFAIDCEGLPHSPFVKSTVWTYFNIYPPGTVFMGAVSAYLANISVEMFLIKGGLDDNAKKKLIRGATELLVRHAAQRSTPVYIVVHEIPETSWGFLGETANLAELRKSPIDKSAL